MDLLNGIEKFDKEEDILNLNWIENQIDEKTGKKKNFVDEALKKKRLKEGGIK